MTDQDHLENDAMGTPRRSELSELNRLQQMQQMHLQFVNESNKADSLQSLDLRALQTPPCTPAGNPFGNAVGPDASSANMLFSQAQEHHLSTPASLRGADMSTPPSTSSLIHWDQTTPPFSHYASPAVSMAASAYGVMPSAYPHQTLSMMARSSEKRGIDQALDMHTPDASGPDFKKRFVHAPVPMKKTQFKGKSSMMETPCKCKTCGEYVAKFHFHGPGDLLLATKMTDFECYKCSEAAALRGTVNPIEDRLASVKEVMACFLCRKVVGSGCVLVKRVPPETPINPADPPATVIVEEYESPQFLTQIMCTPCDSKYKFCSQCGGGSIRTGKYRPSQLFENGRKTCSLAHVRLGDKISDFEMLDITSGLSDEKYKSLLLEMENMHKEFLLGFNAVPEMMEKPEWPLKDYDALMNSTTATTRELFSYLVKPLDPSKSRRYLALAFVNEEKKTGYRSPHSPFMTPFDTTQIEEGRTYHRSRVLAGFSVIEWDCAHGILLLNSQVLRAMNRRSTLDQDLLSLLVRKTLEERDNLINTGTMNTPPVYHIWTMIRHEHSRFLMHAARMGFVERDLYFTGSQPQDGFEHHIQLSDVQKRLFSELIVSVPRFQQLARSKMKPVEMEVWESMLLSDYMKWKRSNA